MTSNMKGIVIACPNRYESICLNNITVLRDEYNCNLPIEIWEIGNEISEEVKNNMKEKNVIFKNVCDYCDNPNHWRGFQVKVFSLYNSEFDEVILCDADVTFYKNPEFVFEDDNYIRTGTYFFKDLEMWVFSDLKIENTNKFSSLDFFNKRKGFIKNLIPKMTDKFPKEWSYIYDETIPTDPVKEALQESGVVYINKTKHDESLKYIYELNDKHDETYNYLWGDKETFWLGCVMADKDFYFNKESGIVYNDRLTHFYEGSMFWKQK